MYLPSNLYNTDYVWRMALADCLEFGTKTAPRGQETRELWHNTVQINMESPVVCTPERALSYQFMAAEAYWILTGDNTVAGIAPWNKNISQFSDDGQVFYGAYGPKFIAQLPDLLRKLEADPDSRQAGFTLWRENPPATKDVPCTIAGFAHIRHGELNLHVFMRSSDLWLGLPYDIFNFSCMGYMICAMLNRLDDKLVCPGRVFVTAASSHLYEPSFEKATRCASDTAYRPCGRVPCSWWMDENRLLDDLKNLRDSKKGDPRRWWEV